MTDHIGKAFGQALMAAFITVCVVMTQIILLFLKLAGALTLSWWWVFSPVLAVFALYAIMIAFVCCVLFFEWLTEE